MSRPGEERLDTNGSGVSHVVTHDSPVSSQLPVVENSDFQEDETGQIYETIIENNNSSTSSSVQPINEVIRTSEMVDQTTDSSLGALVNQTDSTASPNEIAVRQGTINTLESISAKVDSVNSLYGSNEKIVFLRSTSDYSASIGEQTNIWKNVVLGTVAPYALVGVPVTSLYQLSQRADLVVNDTVKWLKFGFSTPILVVTNGIEIVIMSMLNLVIIYLFASPAFDLLRSGQLSERLISLTIYLYEIIPLIFGYNVVWAKGYLLCNIVKMLDRRITYQNMENRSNPFWTMFKMLSACVCLATNTTASVVSFEWKLAHNYATVGRNEFYYHLIGRFFILLFIPVYLAVLSGVHFRVSSLNNYIRSTSTNGIETINTFAFQKIKNLFKQNADLICQVNYVFNILVSDVLLIVVIGIIKDLFQIFLLVTVLDSFSVSLEKGSQQVNQELISMTTKWIMLDTVAMVCKFMLIILTFRKVREVNREARQVLLHLNDMASYYIEKPNEIYQSFCLVKYYIKARNERDDDPAFLRLLAAEWIPCVKIR